MECFIVYCSPAGTTRLVSEIIERTLVRQQMNVELFDLAANKSSANLFLKLKNSGGRFCLYLGTPVYACHAVPMVTEFITHLPHNIGGFVVPYVTWGGVTSGLALYEMAASLIKKGYLLVGAAKVLAVHSLMWQLDSPLGYGHPDADDEKIVSEMAAAVTDQLKISQVVPLNLSVLAYQPEKARDFMKHMSLEKAREMLPKHEVDLQQCSACGICEKQCPAQAISCDPYPEFSSRCILCYNCMRLCPEKAIHADFSMMESFIRSKAEQSTEQPLSQVFI